MEATCEICVIGGSPAGIAAAVRSAREGRETLLVTPYTHIGGVLSNGLSCWDTWYDGFRAPIQDEWLAGIRAHYRETYGEDSENYRISQSGPFGSGRFKGAYTWEPHVAEMAFEKLIGKESKLGLVRGYYPVSVERAGRLLRAVVFHSSANRNERLRLTAKVFIDTSYEADVAALAGVPYRIGREDRHEYCEIYAGKIFVKRSGNEANFSHDSDEALQWPRVARRGKLNIRPWWGTTQEIFSESTGEGDDAVQASNFRVCLTSDTANKVKVKPPEGYDRSDFLPIIEKDQDAEALFPYEIKSGLLNYPLTAFPGVIPLPGNKCDWNAAAIPGGVDNYPDADWPTRIAIVKRHRKFALGLLYFLQNDSAVPDKVRTEARRWALPRDEFTDNGHFPHEFYLREARRIVGRYVMRESDACIGRGLQRSPVHHDAVAIAEWIMDSHDCTPGRVSGAEGDGFTSLSEYTRPSQIPYRSLFGESLDNLIMGLAISATHVVWGSIRVEPCYMHIGETAGHAAAMALEQGRSPADLDVSALQRRLAENQVMLTFFNEFDMATDQPWVAAVQFLGTKGLFGSFDACPDDALTEPVAGNWARIFGELLDDSVEAGAWAREVAVRERREASIITTSGFRNLLRRELEYRGRSEPDLIELERSLGIDESTPLSRAKACQLIYRLLQ